MKKLNVIFLTDALISWTHSSSLSLSLTHWPPKLSIMPPVPPTARTHPFPHRHFIYLFIYFLPYWNYLHARRAGASARAGHGGVRITFKQGHSTLSARACMRVWSSACLPSGRVPAPPSLQTGACVCTRASVIARGEVGLLSFFFFFMQV